MGCEDWSKLQRAVRRPLCAYHLIAFFPCSVLGVTVEAASLPEEKEEELEEEKEEVGASAPDAAACSLGAEGSLCPFRIVDSSHVPLL